MTAVNGCSGRRETATAWPRTALAAVLLSGWASLSVGGATAADKPAKAKAAAQAKTAAQAKSKAAAQAKAAEEDDEDDETVASADECEWLPAPSTGSSYPSIADPLGMRSALGCRGITYGFNYIGEVLSNVSGGVRRGAIFEGELEGVVDIDLETLMGWKGGAIHATAFWTHGKGLTDRNINSIFAVSNIEEMPTVRLYELWFEQKLFDDKASIRAGQLAADSEFFASTYSGLFINDAFGFGIFSANLPSGGTAYSLATPAVRLKLDPTENLSFMLGVFSGGPAGTCDARGQQACNRHGVNFRTQDAAFVIGEAAWKYNVGPLPGTLKLGGWTHFGDFPDQRLNADNPLGPRPVTHAGNHGLYGIVDQLIYKLPGDGDKGIGWFLRTAVSPDKQNLIDFYFDTGLSFSGLVPRRPDDVFGLAFGYGRISNQARGFAEDTLAAAIAAGNPRSNPLDFEAVFEVSYKAQIIPGLYIQPDFQYIFHPGGSRNTKDAAVFGARVIVNY
jgi:porin